MKATDKLAQLAAELRELSPSDPPLSPEILSYLEGALKDFLGGKAKTLDKAFGLKGARGRPRGVTARTVDKARQVGKLKASQSYSKIAGQDGLHHSPRYLKRLPKRAKEILAAEHSRHLADELIGRLKRKGGQ